MSDQVFHKIFCSQCRGKIEFPAEYAGQTISCPHCQTLVTLKIPPADPAQATYDYPDPATLTPAEVAKGQKTKLSIIYAVALLLGVNAVFGLFLLFRSKPSGPLEGVQVTTWKLEPGEYRTFYLTGAVSNSTSKVIPDARVDFETLDGAGAVSGKVSAVVSNLQPNASSEFSIQTSATQTVWDAKVVGVFLNKK